MTARPGPGSGRSPDEPADVDEAALDALDAAPLDPDEAASGAERAAEAVGESLAELVARVAADLDGAGLRGAGDDAEATLDVDGRVFAVLPGAADAQVLDVALDGPVTRAALATPDTSASPRGAGWVRFAPRVMDRYAADRAEAWIRFAHRRASGER